MKTNIKMRVTPEQSKRVQEICFNNGVYWNTFPEKWDIRNDTSKFLYIKDVITHSFSKSPYSDDGFKEENDFFHEQEFEEIDADLFISESKLLSTESHNERLNDSLGKLIDIKDNQDKEIEKLKAVIEYLESKVKWKN